MDEPRDKLVNTLADRVWRDLRSRADEWIHGSEDEMSQAAVAAFDRAVPEAAFPTFVGLFAAEVCQLQAPAAFAPRMGGIIRDALYEAVDAIVMPQADEMWQAHDPAECLNLYAGETQP